MSTHSLIPSILILEYTNLRTFVIIGSALNIVGAIMKVFSNDPSLAWLTWTGQASCAIAQPFIMGVPPRLAAIWFPADEVSTATAIGVFGNQLGVAIGFLIPPFIVMGPVNVFHDNGSYPSDWSNVERYPNEAPEAVKVVSHQIWILSMLIAVMSTLSFLSVVFLFKKEPLQPPSIAEASRRVETTKVSPASLFFAEFKMLMSNRSFILLLLSYGLNGGCYYAISALINQLIKPSLRQLHHLSSSELDIEIGEMGHRVHKYKTF